MIFNETYDYLFSLLAGSNDAGATMRLKDYQRKRLKRVLLARSIRPYTLEASWAVTAGLIGEEHVALTLPSTRPLIVLDGAIRTSWPATIAGLSVQMGTQADRNNFELQLIRTGGGSSVQIMQGSLKDEHVLTPAQVAIRPYQVDGRMGQGASNPLTWPVPLRLQPNELIQIKSKVLGGGVTGDSTTFCQFRAVAVDNQAEDDTLTAELHDYIKASPVQRPIYLSMTSENAKSIAFPATGALQRTVAKTREASEHLLIIGYAALFGRSVGVLATGMNELGAACGPKWRLESSNGYAFSKEEIDIGCYAYPGPGFFWNEFPQPFFLPKGSSLSASFSTLDAIATALDQIDNYVFFRCVTV